MAVIAKIYTRALGSTIPGKTLLPILGKPMLAWCLESLRESGQVDRILVWTEDAEIGRVAEQSGAMVLRRPREMVFYEGGFSDPAEWKPYMDRQIEEALDGRMKPTLWVHVNCNFCLVQPATYSRWIRSVKDDDSVEAAVPVAPVTGPFAITNNRSGFLFPILEGLREQDLALVRPIGISVARDPSAPRHRPGRTLHPVVSPEESLDVENEDRAMLAEYYLMSRLGAKTGKTRRPSDRDRTLPSGTHEQPTLQRPPA